MQTVLLEAEQTRELLERALEVRHALERECALLVEAFLIERDFSAVSFPACLGLHTHRETQVA